MSEPYSNRTSDESEAQPHSDPQPSNDAPRPAMFQQPNVNVNVNGYGMDPAHPHNPHMAPNVPRMDQSYQHLLGSQFLAQAAAFGGPFQQQAMLNHQMAMQQGFMPPGSASLLNPMNLAQWAQHLAIMQQQQHQHQLQQPQNAGMLSGVFGNPGSIPFAQAVAYPPPNLGGNPSAAPHPQQAPGAPPPTNGIATHCNGNAETLPDYSSFGLTAPGVANNNANGVLPPLPQAPLEMIGSGVAAAPPPPAPATPAPPTLNFLTNRPPIPLFMDCDTETLSEYQCLLRRQIELFEAGPNDIRGNAQGRNTPISLGQVGIRCRHCAILPPAARPRGAVYFSQTIDGIYQVAQNMSKVHLCNRCHRVPEDTKRRLKELRSVNQRASGGKQYWSDGIKAHGIYGDGRVLRFQTTQYPT